jgi:hypothetical protein
VNTIDKSDWGETGIAPIRKAMEVASTAFSYSPELKTTLSFDTISMD